MTDSTPIKKRALTILPFLVLGIITVVLLGSSPTKTETSEARVSIKKESGYNITSIKMPSSASFAGEKVPLERVDIRERLDRELLSNAYFHSNTILLLKRANLYFTEIERILKEEKIPKDFKYIALIESGFDPLAISPAGAVGMWQFLKSTGKEYGLEVNTEIDERYDMEKSTRAACRYFRKAYERFGSWSLVAASYNTGQKRISDELERQSVDNYYDLLLVSETSRYVFRVLALKEILEKPQQYGFLIKKEDLYPSVHFKEVNVSASVEDFGIFAKEHGISYGLLKKYNPWLRNGFLSNAKKKRYTIKIPTKESLKYKARNIRVYQSNWVVNP